MTWLAIDLHVVESDPPTRREQTTGMAREANLTSKLQALRTSVDSGLDRFEKDKALDPNYVSDIVGSRLSDALREVSFKVEEWHKLSEGRSSESTFVVHYTSLRNVIEILQSQETKRIRKQATAVRLYDSVHLNDPTEGTYLADSLTTEFAWGRHISRGHAYISSYILPKQEGGPRLSNDLSDDLVFWRTYGREGKGCSLKISVPTSELRQVFYGKEKTSRAAHEILRVLRLLDPLVRIKSMIKSDIRRLLADCIWEALGSIQYLYKSEAYHYERECRVVLHESDVDSNSISFDYQISPHGEPMLRHFFEHQALRVHAMMSSGSLITVGPCVTNGVDVVRSLNTLSKRARLYDLRITKSEIPYRLL